MSEVVVSVTVYADGSFQVAARPEHRHEVAAALAIIAEAVGQGGDHLIRSM